MRYQNIKFIFISPPELRIPDYTSVNGLSPSR